MIRTANLIASVSRNAGGLFESVRRLVQSLDAVGMQVRVLSVEDQFTAHDKKAWQPVEVKTFPTLGPELFCYSPGFLRDLRDFKPDILHSHGIWLYPSVATTAYSKERGCPYMLSAHGMLDPWAMRNSRWKKIIANALYEGAHLRGARCLRALCEPEARAIRHLNLKSAIAVIPNGIDLPTTSPAGPPPWVPLVGPGKKVLLYLGRIHPKKGLPYLLKAWAQIQKSESRVLASEWVLALAGWDQSGHEGELKRLAGDLGLKSGALNNGNGNGRGGAEYSVVFLGPQFEAGKAACYHFCDGFILPSVSEGLPMVVLEAWARKKAVLMTPQCNVPAGFVRNAALRIDPNVESVVNGLNQFLRMTVADRLTMGCRGYSLAAEEFAWPSISARMKEAYEWILGGGSEPSVLYPG
jgi:poly(glycerol-phosphate) alpha-glucosyltransferase